MHNNPGILTPDQRVVIIGAGPTGLGAGYRLAELGHDNFVILDQHDRVGGLARSFVDEAGFTWDIGGHVMFSHYDYYDQLFDRMMGDEYSLNERESWVRLMDRWVPYPFQNNIRYLPPEIAFECLAGLIRAQTGKGAIASPADATNFGEFIDAVFGEGIARVFMRPYNFKVWAHAPELMNKTWIGERVAVIDYERALRNVVLGTDDFGWGPNNKFKYPLRGGTGSFYSRIGEHLVDHLRPGKRVERVDPVGRVVRLADGTTERFDVLISAMPLDILVDKAIGDGAPGPIRAAASGLLHSAGHMVGIGIKRPCPSTKSWMYFPEDNCPFYRVTYLSNYSPTMTPDAAAHYSLLCETSQSDYRPVDPETIIEQTITGLERAGLLEPGERDDIVTTWHYFAEYSYPTPSVERDEILARVIPWLEDHAIYSRGRFGMWKYEVANTDHTLMQGVELVDRLVRATPEQTIGMVYRVTEDGRRAAEHGRSALAGSGEKRLATAGGTPEVKPQATGVAGQRTDTR